MRTGFAIALWWLAPDKPGSVQGVSGVPERSGEGLRLRRFPSLSASRVALILMLAASAVGVQTSTPSQARAMSLAQVDGGPNYYGQFSNPLPDKPGWFPIAGFLRPVHNQGQVNLYKDFGLNVISGLENPELTNEALLRQNGLKAIVQADERTRFNDIGSETAGWMLRDEVDMCCGPPGFDGGNGYEMQKAMLNGLPNDGRFRYTNYGKGVMFWETDAQAAQFVNQYQQVVSNDIYWFTDPNERNQPGYRVAASYGGVLDRMRFLDAMDGQRQPNWAVVELGWPFTESAAQGGRRILPAELRAAVWHSIIAGARGIIYFDHNFGPGTPGSTILGEGYGDNRAMAKSVNAQIKSLAPVLNSPTVRSGWSQGAGTTAMVKWAAAKKAKAKKCKSKKGTKKKCKKAAAKKAKAKKCKSKKGTKKKCKKAKGNLYVFAGSAGSPVEGRFSLPCVGDAKAEVVGENRTIPIRKGSFSDQFAGGNAIHIYRIDGGVSKCGVSGQGKVAQAGLTGGGDPAASSNTLPWVIAAAIVAVLVGLLFFLGLGPLPKRAPPRSGMRAKRTQRLPIR